MTRASGWRRSGRRRSGRGLTVLACLLVPLAAAPVAAGPSPAVESWDVEGRELLIETITVEGLKRVSPELVVAESLLTAGSSYSERELQVAVRRIQRLPFLLDARLSLRKGSHHGAYELVIAAVEARPLFFGVNLERAVFGSPLRLDENLGAVPLGDTESADDLALAAGVRWFVGSQGVVFAGIDSDGGRVGYLHYNLLGRHIFGGVQLTANTDCCVGRVFALGIDPALGRWILRDARQADLEVAFPLSPVRSVRLGLGLIDARVADRIEILDRQAGRFFDTEDVRSWRLTAQWIHDSTDDPVLPRRGARLSAGLVIETLGSLQTVTTFEPLPLHPDSFTSATERLPDFESRQAALEMSGARHLPLTLRQVVSLGAGFSVGRSRVENLLTRSGLLGREDLTTYGASTAVRWSIDLRNPHRLRPSGGDLRLEAELGYGWEGTAPSLDLVGNPLEKLDLQVAVVLRNTWGVFRFGLTYLDAGEILR